MDPPKQSKRRRRIKTKANANVGGETLEIPSDRAQHQHRLSESVGKKSDVEPLHMFISYRRASDVGVLPNVDESSSPESASVEVVDGEGAEKSGSGLSKRRVWRFMYLTLGALGVVYGDIGTSPLYAYSVSLSSISSESVNLQDDAIGCLSLIIWALLLVVSIQYACIVLSLDHKGEGGEMALSSQLMLLRPGKWASRLVTFVAICGTALVIGDGCLTPAISVLSAVEGISVYNTSFSSAVVPVAIVIIISLFLVQSFGAGRIGRFFGFFVLLWLLSIAGIGIANITRHASVFRAFDPSQSVFFLARHGRVGVFVLGSVLLSITGLEALFADLGHFGAGPIRLGWFLIALPCLLLSYMGQAAFAIESGLTDQLFYLSVPEPLLWPMIVMATIATVIASQALISGSFSLVNQAIQLDLFPHVGVYHTSSVEVGQIYIPVVNYTLMILAVFLVFAFQSSAALANAYGIAIMTSVLLTTCASSVVLWFKLPRFSRVFALLYFALFFTIAVTFWISVLSKFVQGGWITFCIAFFVGFVLVVWRWGRLQQIASRKMLDTPISTFANFIHEQVSSSPELLESPGRLDHLCPSSSASPLPWDRLPITAISLLNMVRFPMMVQPLKSATGVGIVLTSRAGTVPPEFVRYVQRSGSVPQTLLFVTVTFESVPFVSPSQRVRIHFTDANGSIFGVEIFYGFAEKRLELLSVIANSKTLKLKSRLDGRFLAHAGALSQSIIDGVPTDVRAGQTHLDDIILALDVTFFVGKVHVISQSICHWGRVLVPFYTALSALTVSPLTYLQLPPEMVVEILSVSIL